MTYSPFSVIAQLLEKLLLVVWLIVFMPKPTEDVYME